MDYDGYCLDLCCMSKMVEMSVVMAEAVEIQKEGEAKTLPLAVASRARFLVGST